MTANEIVWLLSLLATAVFLVIALAVDFQPTRMAGGRQAGTIRRANPWTIAIADRKRWFDRSMS